MHAANSIRSGFRSFLLLCSFLLPAGFALAQQPVPMASAPQITGFDVEPARRLTAGSELVFTLYGTPGGAASMRINGLPATIYLNEVESGVYETTYTIRTRDRLTATTAVTANLRSGNQIATQTLDESLLAGAPSPSARAAAAAAAGSPKIDRFEVSPPARLQSGEDLLFTLYATPAGQASVRIAGVKGKIFLQEMKTGVYEGVYTIKDRDRIAANATTTANLHLGNRDASATLNRSLAAGPGLAPPPPRAVSICANCGVVEAINVVEVKGDGSYIGKIAGGVIGGLLGSQVGQGRGTTAAEIAGAIGGVVVGNEIEKRVKKTTHYDVVARLQGGGAQTVTYATQPTFKVGDKVRVENGVLVSNP